MTQKEYAVAVQNRGERIYRLIKDKEGKAKLYQDAEEAIRSIEGDNKIVVNLEGMFEG